MPTTRRSDPSLATPESGAAVAGSSRCATVSVEAGEQPAGTASRWRACLLVEDNGPWGPKVLNDARLPAAARSHLDRADLRVLLIRRHGRRAAADPQQGGVRVIASWSDRDASWAETTTIPSLDALAEIDVSPLVAGRSLGWDAVTDPVVLVCTHGRRDVCCAERGRPVAAALAASDPDGTWECSHVGGHRYAANVVVLPDGLAYGRVEPGEAVDILARWRGGQIDAEHARGWVWQEPAAQAAEVVVRQRLGLTARADVRAEPEESTGAPAERVRVEIASGAYAGTHLVTVQRSAPEQADGLAVGVLASCGDEQTTPATGWQVGPLEPV